MAKGNADNLMRGHEPTQFKSGRSAVENGRKGGKASAEKKRKQKALKDIARAFGKMDAPQAVLDSLVNKGLIGEGEIVSYDEALMLAQYAKAQRGDTRSAEYIRDTSGQEEPQRWEIEKAKLELEKERLALEREKLELQKAKNGEADTVHYGIVIIPEVLNGEDDE